MDQLVKVKWSTRQQTFVRSQPPEDPIRMWHCFKHGSFTLVGPGKCPVCKMPMRMRTIPNEAYE